MLYYILGILAIVAVHLMIFLKCYEKGVKVSAGHIMLSAIFSLYLVFVIEYVHDKVIEKPSEYLVLTGVFIPIGIIMPIIYRRFKYFLVNAWFILAFDVLLMILQIIHGSELNSIFVIFTLAGGLIGFFISTIVRSVFKDLRKNLIIKKRKKRIILLSLEIEVMTFFIFALFFSMAAIEKISGNDIVEKFDSTFINKETDKYGSIYFSIKKNYTRYDEYANLNPDMDIEEVVWRVNSNLDKEFYDSNYVSIANETTDEPFLINKFNRVSDDFEPKDLVKIEGNYLATQETTKAYKSMLEEMEKEGMKIYVVSSYRSIEYQRNLYNNYLKSDDKDTVDTYSARPGYSEHHTGRALDISHIPGNINAFEGSEEAEWVYENCYRFGFIVRYREENMDVTGYMYEPWHITYVGTEISSRMHTDGIETLEEYVARYGQNY